MRRLLVLPIIAAIGFVAMPAGGASGGPDSELEVHRLQMEEVAPEAVPDTLADEPASGDEPAPAADEAALAVDEIELPTEEIGIVGLRWNGDENAEFRVLVLEDDGNWSELDDVEVSDEGPDPDSAEGIAARERRGVDYVTEPLFVEDPSRVRVEILDGAATGVEVVAVTTPESEVGRGAPVSEAGAFPRGVAIVTLVCLGIALMIPANRRRLSSTASVMALVMGMAVVAAACDSVPGVPSSQPAITTRAQWSARSPACTMDVASKVDQAVVHHTAGSNSYTAAAGPGTVKGIQNFHIDANGWCDIGYNLLVDRYGRIYEGRAGGLTKGIVGAHAAGFNTGSFGVSVLGNFDAATPTAASVDSLVRVLVWKMSVHQIDPSKPAIRGGKAYPAIVGHRDVNSTACPGWELYKRLPEIRARVAPNVVYGVPFGNYEAAIRDGANVRLIGWAIDPDTNGPINIHVYRGPSRNNLTPIGSFRADNHRNDIGNVYPNFGPRHGWDITVPVPPGNIICIWAINVGPGGNWNLGCRPAY